MVAEMGPDPDPPVAGQIDELTDLEVQAGWLSPAMSEEELTAKYGPGWTCAKRFAIRQGAKLRLIDDFSLLDANATVTAAEKVWFAGVDGVAANAKTWAQACRMVGVRLAVSDGRVLVGRLHPEWADDGALGLTGR